jgi:hypothetical protein
MKMLKFGAVAAFVLLAWACVLTPGKFDAALDIRRDGSFSYRYAGEIVLLTGNSMMAAAAGEQPPPFDAEAQTCWDDGSSSEEMDAMSNAAAEPEGRPCTAEEIADKRREWEENRDRQKREAESMKAMLGGIDPSDPKTMDEFARRLQSHEGWKRAVHKGDGVFDVEYEVSGRLDHDFVYPVFPGVDYIIPFVQVTRRTGGRVGIAAPAFTQAQDGGFGQAAMGGAMAGMNPKGAPSPFKRPEGSFTLTTDAEILTNNTNDGPSGGAGAKVLKWIVGPLDTKKPEALLKL